MSGRIVTIEQISSRALGELTRFSPEAPVPEDTISVPEAAVLHLKWINFLTQACPNVAEYFTKSTRLVQLTGLNLSLDLLFNQTHGRLQRTIGYGDFHYHRAVVTFEHNLSFPEAAVRSQPAQVGAMFFDPGFLGPIIIGSNWIEQNWNQKRNRKQITTLANLTPEKFKQLLVKEISRR